MVEAYAVRTGWGNRIELRFIERRGHSQAAGKLEFVPLAEGDYMEPSAHLDMSQAQALMDQLWTCGLRPSEGAGSAGSLKATEKHLEDMRRLAFGALKKSIGEGA